MFRHDCCNLIKDIDAWAHFADPIEIVRKRFYIPARGRHPEYPNKEVGLN
ncbi:hypothetical protein SynMVIR181_01602 [Synechococcus sp. MVIR-18-1]|nr:hypothetical protein SynMVIR181_01602 [Synechococcus sp. MVIR-18-1]